MGKRKAQAYECSPGLVHDCICRPVTRTLRHAQMLEKEVVMPQLEVSHSSSSMFRGCGKKYYWYYLEGLRPKKKSLALSLGRAVHDAFEKYYKGASSSDVVSYLTQTFDEDIAKADAQDVEGIEINKWTALGMWIHYPYKNLGGFSSIVPEKEFQVRLGKLRGVKLVGKVDGLLEDYSNKKWIREVKTTGLSPRQFNGRMNTSSQATGYVYAMNKAGHPVQGVMYDVIKRPLLRKRQTESCSDFCDRIVEDYKIDANAPQNLRKSYLRAFIYRSPYALMEYEKDMERLVKALRHTYKKDNWYRNQDQCWNFNSLCPFEKICWMDPVDKLTVNLYYDREKPKRYC